jgi:hypothetical protein
MAQHILPSSEFYTVEFKYLALNTEIMEVGIRFRQASLPDS